MADPTRFTIVFDDWHLGAFYSANTTYKRCKFYTQSDGTPIGNTSMKLEFANTATAKGHYGTVHAIQYDSGTGTIENKDGTQTTFSGNTEIDTYVSLLDKWVKICLEEDRLAAIPTWDDIRAQRDSLLSESDGVLTFCTEQSISVPAEWTTYRTTLRDIPETYGAESGNTELVVWPTKPAWPTV